METISTLDPLPRSAGGRRSGDAGTVSDPAVLNPAPSGVALPAIEGGVGHALTLAVPIKPGEHRALLAARLALYGGDISGCQDIAFARLRTVHFLRWVIIDTAADGGAGTLVLESNHDGTLAAHVADLLQAGAAGLHAIYGHCVGYPIAGPAMTAADFPAFEAFLARQSIDYGAFYVGAVGKSAERIRLEAELRRAIETFLDRRRREPPWPARPDSLYEEVRAYAQGQGLLDRFRDESAFAPRAQPLRLVFDLGRLVLSKLPLLPLLPWALVSLYRHERTDVPASYPTEPVGIHALASQEDVLTQNQLTHYVSVKDGKLRLWLLRTILRVIDLVARLQQNQGHLGGISSIHFARWVIVDEGRQLLFFSNYDGSWESYLGDFIDKASIGLTGIWTNCDGFPATRWLISGGATDEVRFKAWTRAHQVKTPLWYSAYPDLTVRNILENQDLARGLLQRPGDEAGLKRWLELL